MKALVALAPAKVNLVLAVGRPRAGDGLHPVVSLVQALSLADELRLEAAPPEARRDEVRCPGVTGRNLAADALAAYRAATGWDGAPVRLTIAKRVPVAAGMGGGSSDAAAALRLVATAAGRPEDPVLPELARGLGSDVPALLLGGRTLGTGAGELVTPLPEGDRFGVLVLASEARLATPAVYREFDRLALGRSEEALEALARELGPRDDARRSAAARSLASVNDLEPAARSLAPSIDAALAALRATGAEPVMVSGSGPTVFGRFGGADGPARARAAALALPGAVAVEPVGPEFGRPRPAGP